MEASNFDDILTKPFIIDVTAFNVIINESIELPSTSASSIDILVLLRWILVPSAYKRIPPFLGGDTRLSGLYRI